MLDTWASAWRANATPETAAIANIRRCLLANWSPCLLSTCTSGLPAMRCDQSHRRLADEDSLVKPLAPRQRRDIAVFVHRVRTVTRMELLAQRSADVRIGAMVDAQP